MKRAILPLAAAIALGTAGCPDESGLSCPPNTSTLGQFNLAFNPPAQYDGECLATVDGGTNRLVSYDAGASGIFCASALPDGGTQLAFIVTGKGVLYTPFIDGGFDFVQDSGPTTSTACVCPVTINETFSGSFVPFDGGGPYAPMADGGWPIIADITGTLQDALTQLTSPDATCVCSTPCTVSYGVLGTPF